MPELISKITGLVSSSTASLSLLFVAIAVCAIIFLCISLTVTHNDTQRSAQIKNIGSVLVVSVVAAGAAGLISWVMG